MGKMKIPVGSRGGVRGLIAELGCAGGIEKKRA